MGGPFDLTTAPFAGGMFVGDYEGLAAVDHPFVSVFVTTNRSGSSCERNPTDVYSARFSDHVTGATRSTSAVEAGMRPAAVARHSHYVR